MPSLELTPEQQDYIDEYLQDLPRSQENIEMALRDMVLQMSKNRKIAAMLLYIIENTENNNIFTDVERVNEEDEDEDQDYKVSVSLLGDDIEILENMKQKLNTIFLYFDVKDLSYQNEVNMFTFIISNQSVLYVALVYKELLMIYENIIQEEGFDPLFGKKKKAKRSKAKRSKAKRSKAKRSKDAKKLKEKRSKAKRSKAKK